MSAVGERAARAQHHIADLETALERTQHVLERAEQVDAVATAATRRGRKLLKLLLVALVVGGVVLMVRKALAGGGGPPGNPDPYGSDSTDT
jgi:hypothetical protein